jgi:hypothetical protein
MIDPEQIKENYARMPDEKLISVLKEDGLSIIYEAFIILKREYNKRNLNTAFLAEIENKRLDQSKQRVQSNFEKESNIIENKLWNGVIRLKAENSTNKEIFDWLVAEGVYPELAMEGVNHLGPVAAAFYKKALRVMLLSMLFIFGGIILCFLGIEGKVSTTTLFYGALLIVTPLRFIYTNHKTYQLCEKAMDLLKQEKKE